MFLLMAFSLLAVVSCTKDEAVEPTPLPDRCDAFNFGFVTVFNQSDNIYNLFVDGSFEKAVNGGASIEVEIFTGSKSFSLVQAEGFLFSPTVYETVLSVKKCERYSWNP